MSCIECYELSPTGFPAGIYSLDIAGGTPVWFHPVDTTDGVSRVVTNTLLIDQLAIEVHDDKRVMCQSSSSGGSNQIYKPYGQTYIAQTAAVTPPVGATSVTIMVESGELEISFDSGLTHPLLMSTKEVKTWGIIDSSTMRIKPIGITTFDIHGEKL